MISGDWVAGSRLTSKDRPFQDTVSNASPDSRTANKPIRQKATPTNRRVLFKPITTPSFTPLQDRGPLLGSFIKNRAPEVRFFIL